MANKDLPDVLWDGGMRRIRFSELARKFDRSNKTGALQLDYRKCPIFHYYDPELFNTQKILSVTINKLLKDIIPLPEEINKERLKYLNGRIWRKKTKWKKICNKCEEYFIADKYGTKVCYICRNKIREDIKNKPYFMYAQIKERPKFRLIIEKMLKKGIDLKDIAKYYDNGFFIKSWTYTSNLSKQAKKMYFEKT